MLRSSAFDHRDRQDAGFTLVELLVVIIVIGVLAAVAVPSFSAVRANAKDGVLQSDLAHAKSATVLWSYARATTALPLIGTQLVEWGYAASGYTGAGVAPAYQEGSTAVLFCVAGTSESGRQFAVTTHGPVRRGVCSSSSSEW